MLAKSLKNLLVFGFHMTGRPIQFDELKLGQIKLNVWSSGKTAKKVVSVGRQKDSINCFLGLVFFKK